MTTVYENSPVDSDEEYTKPALVNEEIVTSSVSKEEIISSLLALEQESVEQKVERIKQEILDLARAGNVSESVNLVDQLASIAVKQQTVEPEPEACNKPDSENSALFAKLESRIAQLESFCGFNTSQTPVKFIDSLNSAQKTLKYLSQDVQRVQTAQPSPVSKVDYIYSRIECLDDAIKLLPSVAKRLETLRFVHAKQAENAELELETNEMLERMEQSMLEWRKSLDSLELRIREYTDQSNANLNALL